MFLHELSRSISEHWKARVDGAEYENLVREYFGNCCPYCCRSLEVSDSVIEHLDGMNRYRAGLHVPGNVLVACKKCNSEKRRDDSMKTLTLAGSGWESFLSHNGTHCDNSCRTCIYWKTIWTDDAERRKKLSDNLQKIREFRNRFLEFQKVLPMLGETLPELLTKLYTDCQAFAEKEIKSLLERFMQVSIAHINNQSPQSSKS